MNKITSYLISTFKTLALVIILGIGTYYAQAAWTPATSTPPTNNVEAPINVGSVDQLKSAGLGVNSLNVFGDGAFTGKINAQNYCNVNGSTCVSPLNMTQIDFSNMGDIAFLPRMNVSGSGLNNAGRNTITVNNANGAKAALVNFSKITNPNVATEGVWGNSGNCRDSVYTIYGYKNNAYSSIGTIFTNTQQDGVPSTAGLGITDHAGSFMIIPLDANGSFKMEFNAGQNCSVGLLSMYTVGFIR